MNESENNRDSEKLFGTRYLASVCHVCVALNGIRCPTPRQGRRLGYNTVVKYEWLRRTHF